MTHYSIGEFAKKTGLPISTLRYYEQEKLIYSHREKNNRRYYKKSDIAWTQFIIRLKKTGMSIKNMQEYAKLRYQGDSTIPKRLELLFLQLDELHSQQSEINQHINFLENKIKTYLGIKTD
ncbi:MAG: MerR family transcriptional regulator [Streptococcus gallolyticus]